MWIMKFFSFPPENFKVLFIRVGEFCKFNFVFVYFYFSKEIFQCCFDKLYGYINSSTILEKPKSKNGFLEQVPDAAAAAAGIGVDFHTIICRSFTTRRYIFCTIECFVRIHRDVFQPQDHFGHQDLVRWTSRTSHAVARSLRQGDHCQLGVGTDAFLFLHLDN